MLSSGKEYQTGARIEEIRFAGYFSDGVSPDVNISVHTLGAGFLRRRRRKTN